MVHQVDKNKILISPETSTKTIEYNGEQIVIEHYRATRRMRNEAAEAAFEDYTRKHGSKSQGFSYDVFERTLALRMIKSWNIDTSVATGWDLMPSDLGDLIVKELGILDAVSGITASTKSKEIESAKN